MERLATFNKYQIRFGWVRVIARRGKGTTVSPAELEKHVVSMSARQDEWLAGFAPPQGRASDRAVPDIVRMASSYGIYDRTAERLAWLGGALAELDRWDDRSSPMSWDLPTGLIGLRAVFQTNGSLLFPLLLGWDDATAVRDRVRGALESLAGLGSAVAHSLLNRFENKDPHYPVDTVIRPLLEPLRELGFVEVEKGILYRLTKAGTRFAERLRSYADIEVFLRQGLAEEWLRANGRIPRRLQDAEVLSLLSKFPSTLGGASETTAPEALVVAWLATAVLQSDPDAAADSEDIHQALARLATAGVIDLRPGTLAGEVEVDWTSLRAGGKRESQPEPHTQDGVEQTSERRGEVLRGDGDGSPPVDGLEATEARRAPTPGNHRRAWHAYVHALLLSRVGAVHGGPRVWVWYLAEVLGSTSLPEGVLEQRRKELAFAREPDASKKDTEGRLAAIHAGGLAEIHFAVDAKGRRIDEAVPLFSLLDRWSDQNASSARVRAAARIAVHEVPALQARLGREVREWLATPHVDPDDALRILRFTRWLVEDALLRDGVGTSELYQLLSSESAAGGGEALLARLEGSQPSKFVLTQCFIVDGAPVTSEAINSAVSEFDCFKVIEGVRLAFEVTLECQSPAEARARAVHQRDEAVAWIEFRLAQSFGPGVALVHDDGEPELTIQDYVEGLEPQPIVDAARELGFELAASQQPRRDSAIVRTLQLLRSSRIEPRPALKISHLWAAIEHLVSVGDTTKGPEVIRAVSTAGSWVLLWRETAETFRLMLAGLHTAAFEPSRRAAALQALEWVEGLGVRAEYEKYPESIVQSRHALFGSIRTVDSDDALVNLLRLASEEAPAKRVATAKADIAQVFGEKAAVERPPAEKADKATGAKAAGERVGERRKGTRSRLSEISGLLAEPEPLLAWQLHRFALGYSNRMAFATTLRWVRRDLAGTLAWLYEVRNRVVHEGYTGDPSEDAFLLALYARARAMLDPVVAIVGAAGADNVSLPVRWGLFEELSTLVNEHHWKGIDEVWISRLGRLLVAQTRR